ncbi:putative undecaprenyl-phosphate N-acetylglucosaminyl 1-phosphate transferase [subsurface metagenome]
MMIFQAGFAVVTAFLVNLGLIPIIIRLAHHFKWYDLPDRRKIHTGLIPRLGGTGMFISLIIASLLTHLLIFALNRGRTLAQISYKFYMPFLGIALIYLLGLYDDFKNLRAPYKFILQLAAAGIVTSGGYLIRSLTLPYIGYIHLGLMAYPITVIWIVGISNAINLIDGMDGLAGGIVAFAALSMGIIALIQHELNAAILAFSLLGAVFGFLIFNFPPAKIFMGDSGSLMLGFTLSIFPLMGISKASAFGSLIVPITLLTIPIIDTAAAILRRLRQKRPIISPDKEHIHHKLLEMGLNERQILSVLYGFCLYLAIVSVTSVILPKEMNVYLVLVVWVGSLLCYWGLSYLESKKRSIQAGRDALTRSRFNNAEDSIPRDKRRG